MTESKPDNGYSRPEPIGKMTPAKIIAAFWKRVRASGYTGSITLHIINPEYSLFEAYISDGDHSWHAYDKCQSAACRAAMAAAMAKMEARP